ncbi:MAG: alpha-glucosidase C-terminal domain-containing protein [Clostridia bacterium]|nr:alpha-glucosidase C-terminal domain-containing protein [Clostridia bacterium]
MSKIVYQLALRTFTPEGTLQAATKLLPHVASLGVDILYVCPFYVQENDPNTAYWSVRQIASNTGNPKNPYKISDYFHVDEEYGTEQDLKEFAAEAHRLGLLVFYDLVYLHCGRQAVFIEAHPDFVERNEDGSMRVPDRWPFARLNFADRELREYLMQNMELLVSEYGADGFRCDVGDSVPLDFWQEAFSRVKRLNPALLTLNEGVDPRYIDGTFDMGYSFAFQKRMRQIFAMGADAVGLCEMYENERKRYGKNQKKLLRTLDNHDTASDVGKERNEILMTSRGVDAALVVATTYLGVPFLWNGYELCDDAENCMFSNREHGKRSAMDWSKGFTAQGKRRLSHVKRLHGLYHTSVALSEGELVFVENSQPSAVISYVRSCAQERILVVVNSKNHPVTADIAEELQGTPLLRYGARQMGNRVRLAPYGYLVLKL